MNKKISAVLASLLVYGSSVSFSQRPLPYVQEKKDYAADDVVGTWKWFCGSVVTIKNNGDVKAVWADGRSEDAKYEKIGDNKYRFNWGHNEWIDILKLKQQGNILEGVNQRGDKVTANRISSGEFFDKNKPAKKVGSSDPFYSNFLKSIEGPYAFRPYENGYHKGVITVLEKDEKGVPPFLNVNKDVVSGIIIVKGKASAEAFKESGRKYAYKWFSAGKVTKELCEVYRNEKSNADYPLD